MCAAGAAVLAAECIQVSTEQRRGRLAVEAYSLGQRVHGVPVHISDASGTGNWFSSGVTLPYGDYKVRISAPGFRAMSRDVRINQPGVIVRAVSRSASSAARTAWRLRELSVTRRANNSGSKLSPSTAFPAAKPQS